MIFEAVFGGLTGLLGSAINSYNERKMKELEIADARDRRGHERLMVEAESKATLAEIDAGVQAARAQVEGEIAVAETQAFRDSQRQGQQKHFAGDWLEQLFAVDGWMAALAHPAAVAIASLLALADVLKGIARPAITAYLLGVSTWLTAIVWSIPAEPIASGEAVELIRLLVNAIVYLTTTAVTWWFGDRQAAKVLAKRLERV